MYKVYILYSLSLEQYYVGSSNNIDDRVFRHNNSGSRSTKKAKDWVLMYTEEYPSRPEAVRREQEIKKKKSRKYKEMLIRNAGQSVPEDAGKQCEKRRNSAY
jgi:putative endonuclease